MVTLYLEEIKTKRKNITVTLVEVEKKVQKSNGIHMMTGYIDIVINGVITRRRIIAQGPWIKDINKGSELEILIYPSTNPKTIIPVGKSKS